jgi:multidrug transporter EmrE-like cation transporter
MFRVVIAISIAAGTAAVGQIFFRRGMQQVGSLEAYALMHLLSYFWTALCNPYVIGGTVLSGVSYFSFLAALSWADVTVVLPMAAIEYCFVAFLAVAILKERVPPTRWLGITLVIIGVILIARSGEA